MVPIKQFRTLLLPILILSILPTQMHLPSVVDVGPFIYPLTNSKQDSNTDLEDDDIRVFIAIKTSISGVHGSRMAEIEKTWLQDVMTRPQVDLKFLAYLSPKVLAAAVVESNSSSQESWTVQTPKICGRNPLCCKDQLMFQYYYDHYTLPSSNPFSPWFCSFDDDNYVLVDNLIKVLRSYQKMQNDTKIYVGRPSLSKGIPWRDLNNEAVMFLTGGAGYCISSAVMELGRAAFLNLTNHCAATGLPDDMAIGHTVTSVLRVKQRLDEHFHSHLEIRLRDTLPRDEISKQVSFGYNNKLERKYAMNGFPNINVLYPPEEDPMLFRSLRAFLQKEAGTTA